METTIHINKLSSALQRIDISYCFAPVFAKRRRGVRCSVFLLSMLLSILQIIIATNKRMRIHPPRGDDGLSLFTFRLILYQKGRNRRKRRKVGLNSPPRLSTRTLNKFFEFSQERPVGNALCCLFKNFFCQKEGGRCLW